MEHVLKEDDANYEDNQTHSVSRVEQKITSNSVLRGPKGLTINNCVLLCLSCWKQCESAAIMASRYSVWSAKYDLSKDPKLRSSPLIQLEEQEKIKHDLNMFEGFEYCT